MGGKERNQRGMRVRRSEKRHSEPCQEGRGGKKIRREDMMTNPEEERKVGKPREYKKKGRISKQIKSALIWISFIHGYQKFH